MPSKIFVSIFTVSFRRWMRPSLSFSYFSLYTVQKIFDYHDLKIFDVDELSTHGGSLRLYITHKENNQISLSGNVLVVLEKEKKFGLGKISTYEEFNTRVSKTIQRSKIQNSKFDGIQRGLRPTLTPYPI